MPSGALRFSLEVRAVVAADDGYCGGGVTDDAPKLLAAAPPAALMPSALTPAAPMLAAPMPAAPEAAESAPAAPHAHRSMHEPRSSGANRPVTIEEMLLNLPPSPPPPKGEGGGCCSAERPVAVLFAPWAIAPWAIAPWAIAFPPAAASATESGPSSASTPPRAALAAWGSISGLVRAASAGSGQEQRSESMRRESMRTRR